MPTKKKVMRKRPGEFDRTRFVSEEAELRYETSAKSKALVPERGFLNPGGRTQTIISERHWDVFAKQPSAACIPIVKEFYANASEHRNFTSFVRGKWVPFDQATINRIYQLPNIPGDQYSSFISGEVDWDNLLSVLCKDEAGISWRRKDGKPVNFHSGGLTSESNSWHYFISGKLMPTMNTSEVTRDRACLNYCIQVGLSIDIGLIIHNSIMQYVKSTTFISTSGLGHPSLITALCASQGVSGSSAEETLNPRSVLTKQKICSFTSRLFDTGETSSQARTPPSRQKPGSISDQVGRLREEVHDLRGATQRQGKRQEKMGKQVDNIMQAVLHTQEQQMTFFDYMGEYTSSMSQMFTNCNLNIGPRAVDYPDLPHYKFYTPPPEEEEEEEEDEEEEEEEEEGSE